MSEPRSSYRTPSWGLFLAAVAVVVMIGLGQVVLLAHNAWDSLHPMLVPLGEQTVFDIAPNPLWIDALATIEFLVLLTTPCCQLLVLGTGAAVLGRRAGRMGWRLLLLGVLLAVASVLPWWWATNHGGGESADGVIINAPLPGPGYHLLGAALTLAVLGALVLYVGLVMRPIAFQPPPAKPVPAGWYPDPDGRLPWRWWDGTAWAEGSSLDA